MNLVIRKGNMVFENAIPAADTIVCITRSLAELWHPQDSPFLELNLGRIGTSLCSDQLLQISHRVVWAALDADCGYVIG